jgi:hypothetical protein
MMTYTLSANQLRFEKWVKSHPDRRHHPLSKFEDGRYTSLNTTLLWEAWQEGQNVVNI